MSLTSKSKFSPDPSQVDTARRQVPIKRVKKDSALTQRLRTGLLGALLVLATIIAYQPAWNAGYIWDDDVYVTHNELLTASDGLSRIWFSLDSPSQYFPLVYTTFRIEHALWGLNPKGYHWVNILLHTLAALLVWRLLSRLRLPGAWFASAIFALHPVQVESVAWITECKNVLMAVFFLLTLLAWIRFLDKRQTWLYVLALVFYLLALSSKTTACTLPVGLLLILWLQDRPITKSRLWQIVPFVVLGFAMGLVTMWWERFHQETRGDLFSIGWLERLLIASRGIWFYLGKLVWPANLIFSYPRWTINPSDPLAYLGLAAIGLVVFLLWFSRPIIRKSISAAAIFFGVTLSPVLGFIMLYTFRYTFVADHYQYLAALGPITLSSAGLIVLPAAIWKRVPLLRQSLGGILLLLLGILTWRQCRIYADDETLNRATIEKNPSSWMSHNNLGSDLLEQGKVGEALDHFAIAHELEPNNPDFVSNIGDALLRKGEVNEALARYREAVRLGEGMAFSHYNLATALLRINQNEEAMTEFRKALEIRPNYAEAWNNLSFAFLRKGQIPEAISCLEDALSIRPFYPDALNNLGYAYQKAGRLNEAIEQYRKALKIRGDYADAHRNLGNALAKTGLVHEAIEQYEAALRVKPDDAEMQTILGTVLMQQADTADAILHYEKALEANPRYVPAQNNLAWILATSADASLRNSSKAIELAQQANHLTGESTPAILRTLAASYAEAGRFPEAVQTAQRALQLATDQSDPAIAEKLESEITLYQAGRSLQNRSQTLHSDQ